MKQSIKYLVGSIAMAYYRSRPIDNWPRWLSDLLSIKTPSNVRYKAVASPAGGANINIILSLLERVHSIPGEMAECGVFRGATLIPWAKYLQEKGIGKTIFALDSFQGFDKTIDVDLVLGGAEDNEKKLGGFQDTSYDFVARRAQIVGVEKDIKIIPGYFQETLKEIQGYKFCFVHLDCDIYESYKVCLDFFYPRLPAGAIVLLDEYEDPPWPGCKKAVDEFLSGKPERLQMIERDNYQKFFFVKS